MDYDQDYSRLTATETKWYCFNHGDGADSNGDAGEQGVVCPKGDRIVKLDNEDFD